MPNNLISENNRKLVVESLIDGATITTADAVANIEVRAKSHGLGFCATTISSNTNSVQILAPPFTWSSWSVIDSHVGKVSKTYSVSWDCDTGSLAEIRYYK